MLILVDKRIPESAKNKLSGYGSLIELESQNVVYDAISGHPDIFICQFGDKIIFSPNAPHTFVDLVCNNNFDRVYGDLPLGKKYPETARYNAVITEKFLIHNMKYTDEIITKTFPDRINLHTSQAYTRCNLIPLNDNNFITSDKGIERELLRYAVNVLYVAPNAIILKGHDYGFFGGCCGVNKNTLFIIGSLQYLKDGKEVKEFVTKTGFSIIELYDGPLFDGGGIFFIDP